MFPDRNLILSLRDPAHTGRFLALFDKTTIGDGGINVESVELPVTETGSHDRPYGGQSFSFPNFASNGPVSVSIYEDDAYTAQAWIMDWKKQIYDPQTQIFGVPVDYLRNMTVFLFSVDNSEEPIAKYVIEDLFPIDSGGRAYTYTQIDGRVVLTVSLTARNITFVRG